MAKKRTNGEPAKPRGLLSSRKLCPPPADPPPGKASGYEWFNLTVVPVPQIECERDLARYLQEDLPDWIEAVGEVMTPDVGISVSLESTLFWDFEQVVRFIGVALARGELPYARNSGDQHGFALHAARRALEKLNLAECSQHAARKFLDSAIKRQAEAAS